MTYFSRLVLSITVTTIGFTGNLAAEGRLEGRISDQTSKIYFDGAIVRIKEINLETRSQNGGQFIFPLVPAGTYTMEVEYIGAKTVSKSVDVVNEQISAVDVAIGENVSVLENIIVYGQAAGSANALNQQRAADNLISIVSADSIGQFPDGNVSEALQRIPGVYIERDQGEGRFVGIRGIDPNLNTSRINGVNIPAPERDRRSVALDVIPSDLLEGLEVTKTITPDMDGDSIGGSINVKSLTAFDRDGMNYKFSTEGNYNELENKVAPKVSGTFSNIFDVGTGELGVAFAGSWQDRKFGSDNIETDGGWDPDIEDSGFAGTEEIEQRDYVISRERLGLAFNLDYRPNELAEYYVRSLYSRFEDQEFRRRAEFKLSDGDLAQIDDSSANWTDIEMDRELKDRLEKQNILSIVSGGKNLIDDWTLEYSYGYSKAEEKEPNRRDTQFSEDVAIANAGYTTIGRTPELFVSANGLDMSNFVFDELVVENNITDDEQHSFRLDLTRDMEFGRYSGYVKAGVKYRDREKTDDVNATTYDGNFTGDPRLADFVEGDIDYGLGNLGPRISQNMLNNYIDNNISSFDIDADETLLSSARDYQISEDVLAAYVMSRIDFDDLRIVYGLRFEDTSFEANGFNAAEVDGTPVVVANNFSNDYSDLLPSINLRYKATDNVIIRAAYSKTISRPSFGFLNPSPAAIELDGTDLEIEAGNPSLNPFKSSNFDLALEFYPDTIGVLGFGLFYKDIDDFIFNADVSSDIDVTQFTGGLDITAVSNLEVLQPRNGQSAELWGAEFNWTKNFSNLPAPWNGLMLMTNATYTDSEADLGLGVNAGRDNLIDLPRQADWVGNVVLGYEYGPFSIRFSGVYRDKRLLELDLADQANDLYQDDHLQLDLSAKYDLNDNTQLHFNAINLTDEPFYAYRGTTRFNGQYEEYGPFFIFGLTYRN
ncbi:MAG: TonB-dependent receptor [Gammaproteobacteria bacterium]|nr:TonB-dependent receptor [Gammaproteobacteria bacterium]